MTLRDMTLWEWGGVIVMVAYVGYCLWSGLHQPTYRKDDQK